MIERSGISGRLKVISGTQEMNYKPCVDITFASASKAFGGDVFSGCINGNGRRR